MPFSFDQHGNLTPYSIILVDSLDEFEQTFVGAFPVSTTRFAIYRGLLAYIDALGNVLNEVGYGGDWRLWLNGSFTTRKQHPNDIDVLNLFDDEVVFQQHKERFKPFFAHNAFQTYQTDAYFLLNDGSAQAKELRTYWRDQFGMDRSGAAKGIIELKIELS